MTTTFERVHAALTVASDLDAKLEDMSRAFVAEPIDLHTRLLLSDAQIAAKRALKHLLAAVPRTMSCALTRADLDDATARALASCRDIHWPTAIMDSLRAANLRADQIGFANLGAAIEAERRRRAGQSPETIRAAE